MQAFLDEEHDDIPSSGESKVVAEGGLEVVSEDKADGQLVENEPVVPLGADEDNASGEAVEDIGDFDMQAFLDEEHDDIPSSGESKVVAEGGLEVVSEDKADGQLTDKDSVASSGVGEGEPADTGGDSADFDLQEFLDELENLPSEKDSEADNG